jgi:hypothetical protein
VAEWEFEEIIYSSATTEIEGHPHLFLMMVSSSSGGRMEATLRVFDAANIDSPVEISSLEVPLDILPPTGDIVLYNNYLYSYLWSGSDSRLWILDISEPAETREISRQETEFPLLWSVVSGECMASRTALGNHFAVYDLSIPDRPEQMVHFELDKEGRPQQTNNTQTVATVFSGDSFFVLEDGGVTAFDMSSPSEPRQVSFYANEEWEGPLPDPVEGAGTKITSGISVISDFPEMVVPSGGFMDMAVSGEYAYIAASTLGLVVLDVSDLRDIREVGRMELPARARKIEISGNYAYVMGFTVPEDIANSSSLDMFHPLYIVDISQPEKPILIDSFDDVVGIPPWQSLVVTEETLFFTDFRKVYVIDLYADN